MVTRYDFINVRADVSPEGWIRDRPVLTRSGIFEYRTKTGQIRREYRPDSEVFAANSLGTIFGIPITDSHVGIITAANHRGVIGSVLSSGVKEDSNVVADIIIHDSQKLGDRRDLSLGYVCELDETPGQTESGDRYDAIQKNIKYNHLAVVRSGRAGNARLRLDATDAVHGEFDQETPDMSDPKLVTIRFDNLEYVASPEVANRLTKYEEDMADLKKKYDALEAERDGIKASLKDAKTQAENLSKSALAAARARLKLEEVASKAGVTFDDTTSDRDLKTGVVGKLRGSAVKFDGKSDDYVDSAYDFAIAEDKDDKVGEQRKKLHDRKDGDDKKPDQSSHSARERMLARIRGEKVEA